MQNTYSMSISRASTAALLVLGLCSAMQPAQSQNMLAVPVDNNPPTALQHDPSMVDQIITASDAGYMLRGYTTHWNGGRIFVSATATEALHPNDTAMPMVTRQGGVLKFFTRTPDRYEDPAETEQAEARASSTLGTSKVEDVLRADDGGSRYVAYIVSWHDVKVVVVDPKAKSNLQVGDKIDFRVVRTGSADDKRLSFSMMPTAPAA
jgi:hypothetical protein